MVGKVFKYADYYDAFFQPDEMLELIQKGCFKILRQDKAPSAGKRLAKLQQLQTEGKISEDILLDFEDDIRVDQLAEYLVEVEKLIGGFASRETVAHEMLFLSWNEQVARNFLHLSQVKVGCRYLGISSLASTFCKIAAKMKMTCGICLEK